jgi:hypothetical protein
MSLEELQQQINDQCQSTGLKLAFELPEQETLSSSTDNKAMDKGLKQWQIRQNFTQLNKVAEVAPMPQGDILTKQQHLSSHHFISVFNFASGFYTIEVPEKW